MVSQMLMMTRLIELEHRVADDGVGEGEAELVVAVTGGGCDKEGVSRVKC